MIKSIHFQNIKALRDATLSLGRFTLIVGANGSGKSTAMEALKLANKPSNTDFRQIATANLKRVAGATAKIVIDWDAGNTKVESETKWQHVNKMQDDNYGPDFRDAFSQPLDDALTFVLRNALASFRIFSFDANAIAKPVLLRSNIELQPNGSNLAGVLDNLRDNEPERFEALNEELGRWLPEFDRILFDTTSEGEREFLLRTSIGKHRIQAHDLSHGVLFALAFLTLSYLPNPPAIVCFEEPERGIHPRLLREIQDAMYRLCYPENYNDNRRPIQVIATTHSPYLLDLYKDHPEEIVIAHKDQDMTRFERLSERPDIDKFLQDAPLGDVWYSGILGGVPLTP